MPVKLSVGLSKKAGLPNYGSLGATCHVEVEFDRSTLENNLDQFQQQARLAFVACTQAVNDELARHATNDAQRTGRQAESGVMRHADGGARKATQSQVRALQAIADRHEFDLIASLQRRFNVTTAAELTIGDASQLIDEFKHYYNGSRRAG